MKVLAVEQPTGGEQSTALPQPSPAPATAASGEVTRQPHSAIDPLEPVRRHLAEVAARAEKTSTIARLVLLLIVLGAPPFALRREWDSVLQGSNGFLTGAFTDLVPMVIAIISLGGPWLVRWGTAMGRAYRPHALRQNMFVVALWAGASAFALVAGRDRLVASVRLSLVDPRLPTVPAMDRPFTRTAVEEALQRINEWHPTALAAAEWATPKSLPPWDPRMLGFELALGALVAVAVFVAWVLSGVTGGLIVSYRDTHSMLSGVIAPISDAIALLDDPAHRSLDLDTKAELIGLLDRAADNLEILLGHALGLSGRFERTHLAEHGAAAARQLRAWTLPIALHGTASLGDIRDELAAALVLLHEGHFGRLKVKAEEHPNATLPATAAVLSVLRTILVAALPSVAIWTMGRLGMLPEQVAEGLRVFAAVWAVFGFVIAVDVGVDGKLRMLHALADLAERFASVFASRGSRPALEKGSEGPTAAKETADTTLEASVVTLPPETSPTRRPS